MTMPVAVYIYLHMDDSRPYFPNRHNRRFWLPVTHIYARFTKGPKPAPSIVPSQNASRRSTKPTEATLSGCR